MSHHVNFTATLGRYLYSLAIFLLFMPYFALLCVKAKRTSNQSLSRQFERLGAIASSLKSVKPGGIWFHCASVGEVVTAAPLIKTLMDARPDLNITITTMTSTGSDRVNAEFSDQVAHCYLPFDLPWMLAPLCKRLQPQKLVITEVELWPNVIHLCASNGIQVDVVNARMTERSAARYAKLTWLFRPMLKALNHVYAQGTRDAENYLALGLSPDKLTLSNNMKFDRVVETVELSPNWPGWTSMNQPFVLVAGSTHSPEEQMLLDAAAVFNHILLVLVPRYPERFDEVAQLCKKSGLAWQRLSEVAQLNPDTQVLLVDKMGILNECFQHANMAFVGGSIAPRGGHNALEPAVFGLPIMMGSSRFNNPDICQALSDAGALRQVDSVDSIVAQLRHWSDNPVQADAAGREGAKILNDNRGALEKTLSRLLSELH